MQKKELVMDLYELTMANGYFEDGDFETRVAFDVFYRKNPDGGGFAIFAGLQQILEYLENLHFDAEDIAYLRSLNLYSEKFLEYLADFKFSGNVYSMQEGTIMYPNEPIMTIEADLVQAQIIETEILTQINHQSLVATKANRIVKAASGKTVSDFGARRAHNDDAAVLGARACYIGGVRGTATVEAGRQFSIPVSGTMAHSWVMYFEDEREAFRKFANTYPDNCVLLVDTYDVLKSGVPNAIAIFGELEDKLGRRPYNYGIRLDSGDLAYLAKEARRMLDEAGFHDAKIVVSNSLDEYTITSLLNQGAPIDAFGVGERMITAKSDPVFGAVYKLAAVYKKDCWEPRIKVSETVEKITNPGLKDVYRVYDENGHAVADIIADANEEAAFALENVGKDITVIDPEKPWKLVTLNNCHLRRLHSYYMKNGKIMKMLPSAREIRAYVREQLEYEIWPEEQRFENPHKHYVDMTPIYYNMKMNLLEEVQNGNG